MRVPIYLDYHATTPIDPRVMGAMLPYFTTIFGNAASVQHPFGTDAAAAVDKARNQVARSLNAEPREIIFTSGATESNNLAIKGIGETLRLKGNHIITSPTEHKAVLDVCNFLASEGFSITYLGVDRAGRIDLRELKDSITEKTILVTLMAANNEIGTLHPLSEVGAICRERDVVFHTDATQAVGKIPIDVQAMNIDLLSVSAHKFYGPKGIGALYVRKRGKRIKLSPQMLGGGHEFGLRSGTLNVPLIVGLGKAIEIAAGEMAPDAKRVGKLRDRMWSHIESKIDHVTINGDTERRLYNNLNILIKDVRSNALMMALKEIAISAGSACTTAIPEPSHVLKAIGLSDRDADCSVRIGLGRFTTEEEVDYFTSRLAEVVPKLRSTVSAA